MKKYNLKTTFLIVILIFISLILKKPFIKSFNDDFGNYSVLLLFIWGDNYLVNIIWIVPVLLDIYISDKKLTNHLLNMNVRFCNRKKYCNHLLRKNTINNILLTIFIISLHVIFFGNQVEFRNIKDVIILYIIAICIIYLLNLICLLFFVLIKKFIYCFIIITIIYVIFINYVCDVQFYREINNYTHIVFISLPFIYSILIYIINRIYKKIDFGGEIYDFGDKEL